MAKYTNSYYDQKMDHRSKGCGPLTVIILLLLLLCAIAGVLSSCSPKSYAPETGYQKDPYKFPLRPKRKPNNPKFINLYPMSYYAQKPVNGY